MSQLLHKSSSARDVRARSSPAAAPSRSPSHYHASTIAWEDSDSDGDEIVGQAATVLSTDGLVGAKGYLYSVSPSFSGIIVPALPMGRDDQLLLFLVG